MISEMISYDIISFLFILVLVYNCLGMEVKLMKPILLVVMDGVGFSKTGLGDAVSLANTPTLDYLLKTYPNTRLKARISYDGY